jgi:hypothetical protein
LREWTGPGELILEEEPKRVLEQLYSFTIYTKDEEGDVVIREELLVLFAWTPFMSSPNSRRVVEGIHGIKEIQQVL